MPKELKPCPACHSKKVSREQYKDEVWIECLQCGMRGPSFNSPIANDILAERAWNALPRAPHITPNDVDCKGCPERRSQGLVWTENPPTVPGWYWIRAKKGGKNVVFEVVSEGDQLDVDMAGASFSIEALMVEWSGPIPIPEEPVS